jgi:hypothetical protein
VTSVYPSPTSSPRPSGSRSSSESVPVRRRELPDRAALHGAAHAPAVDLKVVSGVSVDRGRRRHKFGRRHCRNSLIDPDTDRPPQRSVPGRVANCPIAARARHRTHAQNDTARRNRCAPYRHVCARVGDSTESRLGARACVIRFGGGRHSVRADAGDGGVVISGCLRPRATATSRQVPLRCL